MIPLLSSRRPVGPIAWVATLAVVCLLVQAPARAADEARPAATLAGWSRESLALAATLPVQEGGRLKPFSTLAETTFLAFSTKKSLEREGGERLRPTEWLLDVLFVPEIAARHRVFYVADDSVLDAIGLPHADRSKRGWYSFVELKPAFRSLIELGHSYEAKPPAERDHVEDQVATLYRNVLRCVGLQRSMAFATVGLPVGSLPSLRRFFGDADEVPWSLVLERIGELRSTAMAPGAAGHETPSTEEQDVRVLLQSMQHVATPEGAPALFPPPRSADGTPDGAAWRSAHDLLVRADRDASVPADTLALVRQFEALGRAAGDSAAAHQALRDLHTQVTERARERGEYERVPLEAAYNRLDPTGWSLRMFLLGFVLALVWLALRGKWARVLGVMAWVVLAAAETMLVGGIVMRCVIRGRPPITSLYEVTLFIAATSVLAMFALEILTRARLWIALAGSLGTLFLFIADGFQTLTAGDTMPTLVPVLDTNFWLATHVTCVSMGYTAGLVAAAIAHVYVLGRAFGFASDRPSFYTGVARATYGMICFGLVFSVVGTILGGIWANDSWGRFWGWDPKENGALMIVLWELAMLHARLGGFVGPFGFAMMSIVGGGVVVFSYWGVNLLNVGLHNYGFTAGLSDKLWIYGSIEVGVLLAGALTWWLLRGKAEAA